jgi:hypothetical protein
MGRYSSHEVDQMAQRDAWNDQIERAEAEVKRWKQKLNDEVQIYTYLPTYGRKMDIEARIAAIRQVITLMTNSLEEMKNAS